MPVMDGLEATKLILGFENNNKPSIVAMTANTSSEDRIKCSKVGMCDFISKPFSSEEIVRILKKF